MAVSAVAGSQGLWFLSRGSGLVLLVLFSAVVVLGVATRTGSAPRRWPRFAVAELHRTLSLFAVALLVLHVVTAILDPFVTIGWAATVLPFASPYRTLAIGLGTLAVAAEQPGEHGGGHRGGRCHLDERHPPDAEVIARG